MIVTLHREALEDIRHHARASADGRETGGILLGKEVDFPAGVCIRHAGGPGPNAVRGKTVFVRDLAHAQRVANELFDRDGSTWVGEWHTHPNGAPVPSSRDLRTYEAILENAELGFSFFSSLIVTKSPESTGESTHTWERILLWPWVIRPRLLFLSSLGIRVLSSPEKSIRAGRGSK